LRRQPKPERIVLDQNSGPKSPLTVFFNEFGDKTKLTKIG